MKYKIPVIMNVMKQGFLEVESTSLGCAIEYAKDNLCSISVSDEIVLDEFVYVDDGERGASSLDESVTYIKNIYGRRCCDSVLDIFDDSEKDDGKSSVIGLINATLLNNRPYSISKNQYSIDFVSDVCINYLNALWYSRNVAKVYCGGHQLTLNSVGDVSVTLVDLHSKKTVLKTDSVSDDISLQLKKYIKSDDEMYTMLNGIHSDYSLKIEGIRQWTYSIDGCDGYDNCPLCGEDLDSVVSEMVLGSITPF